MKRPYVSMLVFGPRLIAIVSALSMTQGLPVHGQEAYDIGQLQDIERFIVGRDCGGLWSYVQTNPHLVQGQDPLAVELSRFVERTQTGPLNCFGSSQQVNFLAKGPRKGPRKPWPEKRPERDDHHNDGPDGHEHY